MGHSPKQRLHDLSSPGHTIMIEDYRPFATATSQSQLVWCKPVRQQGQPVPTVIERQFRLVQRVGCRLFEKQAERALIGRRQLS